MGNLSVYGYTFIVIRVSMSNLSIYG